MALNVGELYGILGLDDKQFNQKLDSAGNKFKKFGDKLTDMGKQMSLKVTAPIMAAGGAVLALATNMGEYAEQLKNMSAATGLTSTQLQELKFIADNAGLSFESIANTSTVLQRKLMGVENDTGTAADTIKRLGVNVYDSSGQLRSMDSLFPELISKLQGMGNATERNMLAAQIFGRNLADIAPILGMTAGEMEAAKKRARELGVVLDEDALKAAQEFDDMLDDLKQTLIGMANSVAKDLMPVLKNELVPFIRDKVVPMVKDGIKWFMGLSDSTKKWMAIVAGIAALAGPFLVGAGQIAIGIGLISKATIAGSLPLITFASAILAIAAAYVTLKEGWSAGKEIIGNIGRQVQSWRTRNLPEEYDKNGKGSIRDEEAKRVAANRKSGLVPWMTKPSAPGAPAGSGGTTTGLTPEQKEALDKAKEEELQALEQRKADKLRLLGDTTKAEIQEANNALNQKLRALDEEGKRGLPIADRIAAALTEKEKAVTEAKRREAEERKRINEESLKKQQEQDQKYFAQAQQALAARESIVESQYRLAGKDREADYIAIVNAYNAKMRDLAWEQQTTGRNTTGDQWAAYGEARTKEKQLKDQWATEDKRAADEAQAKRKEDAERAVDDMIAKQEKAQSIYKDLSIRMTEIVFGETASRMKALDFERDERAKAIAENILDERERAWAIKALDADVNEQKQRLYEEELRRQGVLQQVATGARNIFGGRRASQMAAFGWRAGMAGQSRMPSMAFAGGIGGDPQALNLLQRIDASINNLQDPLRYAGRAR